MTLIPIPKERPAKIKNLIHQRIRKKVDKSIIATIRENLGKKETDRNEKFLDHTCEVLHKYMVNADSFRLEELKKLLMSLEKAKLIVEKKKLKVLHKKGSLAKKRGKKYN